MKLSVEWECGCKYVEEADFIPKLCGVHQKPIKKKHYYINPEAFEQLGLKTGAYKFFSPEKEKEILECLKMKRT